MQKNTRQIKRKIRRNLFSKYCKSIATLVLIIFILQVFLLNEVFAASQDYTVIDGKRIPIPETYILNNVINNVGSFQGESGYFKEPQDLFINQEGYLFVADTGNNRIVKLTQDGKISGVFKGPKNKPLKSPQGIYADDKGNMYIADTGNLRVVHLSSEGEYIEEFIKPESELLGKSFTFDPTKIFVSPTGYIYVLKGQTFVTIDAHNRFRGYLGQTQIGFSMLDQLLRIFASDEQKNKILKRTAASYTNITMDEKGTIYATSLDMAEGEIKKLNSVGKNIYRKYSAKKNFITRLVNSLTKIVLENNSFVFGERIDDEKNPIKPVFEDIAIDKNGIITVIESVTGKLYQYDQDGNLLAVFGGKGDQKGKFSMPVSLATDRDGRIYVLDRVMGNIQTFEPTKFIKNIHEAVGMYSKGNYDEAYKSWDEVLKIDENYQLAHMGLANSLYKTENWKAAMEEYKLADNRDGYSKAYVEYRYDMFRNYFAIVVLCLIILAAALMYLIKYMRSASSQALEKFRSRQVKMNLSLGLKMSLGVIFHPIETFDNIKNGRGRLNLLPGIIILASVLVTRILYILVVHYPLADVDFKNSNIGLEAVKLLLPVVTWVVASFAITAILDGESKIDEIFLATCYCMVPYVLVTFPLAIVSRVLTRTEVISYGFIFKGTWFWVLLLFFLSLRTLNDYRIWRTTVTYTISGVTMTLIWFVSLLGYVLTGRIFQFIGGIIREIRMIWL